MHKKTTTLSGSSSLERLIPDEIQQGESTGDATMKLHIERYEWAAAIVSADKDIRRILDAACGVGYGSAILATCRSDVEVLGADIDAAAVTYARERYGPSGATYIQSDISKLKNESFFDAIISLETIEHVPNPIATINTFRELLGKRGLFILSVPVTPSVDVNPYHLTDFSVSSIRKILRAAKFEIVAELKQTQTFNPIKIVTKQESRLDDMRKNLILYYLKNPASCLNRVY
jgi:2-polyprenyl-3-methyl-5-hydroxy-6-metoxy-1,4-benzoquinol methylase